MIHLVWGERTQPGGAAQRRRCARVTCVEGGLSDAAVSPSGAFVVLVGFIVAGLLLLFNTTLRALLQPGVSGGGRCIASARRSSAGPRRSPTARRPRIARGRALTRKDSKERKPVAVPVERAGSSPRAHAQPRHRSSQTVVAAGRAGARRAVAVGAAAGHGLCARDVACGHASTMSDEAEARDCPHLAAPAGCQLLDRG